MVSLSTRVLTAATLVLGVSVAVPAAQAIGPGSFTSITTPAHDVVFHYNTAASATNTFAVSGSTSLDITSVDVVCLFRNGPIQVRTYASAVPVTAGTFSTTAHVTSPSAPCRLRAVPSGLDIQGSYLGAFAGPIMRMWTVGLLKGGSTVVAYLAIGEERDAIAQATDAGQCGIASLATVDAPAMEVRGSALSANCTFALPAGNVTNSGTSTASSITVDGKNAYLPYVVLNYLKGTLALPGLTQSALSVTSTRASNGDITVTESAPLVRCNPSNTYPPTNVSCTSVVDTGVRFRRVLNLFRGDHQARVRDSYTSTNGHAHTVRPAYQAQVTALDYGAVGFRFPGQGTAFKQATPDETVVGLGTRAATVLARNDRYAAADDPLVDTFGLSWSRAPQKLQFSHTVANQFAMPYVLAVPAGGSAYLGFAESEHVAVSDTVTLAKTATDEMVGALHVTAPASGATVKGKSTTVTGYVGLGANGLPTSVTVNGHAATLTTVSPTKRTFKVSFTETLGKHKITVTAKDSAGNAHSVSFTITNV